ncbi:MAG TPA: glycine zipper 2TM domain-containing protein [Rhodanobacteraceae bacterium]
MKNQSLTRAVLLALGIVAAVGLAGCSKSGSQQAQATPANLSMATSAASAALPGGGGDAAANGLQAQAAQPAAAPARAPAPAPAQPAFARVVAVQPVTQAVTTSHPRRVCQDEQVAVPETYKDQHQIGGAVAGGLIGALAGHLVGGGKGKTLATVAGAAGGAFAGHEIQKKHQEDNATTTKTENVCHTVDDKTTSTKTVGYDVTYSLSGRTGHIRMDHNPGVGTGLPVQNGTVVAGN